MKYSMIFSLIAVLCAGNAAFAETVPPGVPVTRLACATAPLTTSHVLTETPEFFELSIIHHNGVQNMPFFDGVVTPRGLNRLKELANLYEKLGDLYRVRFDKSQCRIEGGEWVCGKTGQITLGGLEVQSVWFTVEKKRVVTRYVDFTGQVARFLFTKDRMTHQMSLEYSLSDCIMK